MDIDRVYLEMDEYDHINSNLIYSPTNVPGKGANVAEFENQLLGCKCSDGNICLSSSFCRSVHICEPNYSSDKILLEEKWVSAGIVECNSLCDCSDLTCENRVVQLGPRKNLEIFMSGAVKGYGLKSLEFIPKGAFICEYAGELIGWDEAKSRFKAASLLGNINYIFVLREIVTLSDKTSVIETIVDPSFIGNIGRYINHSCDPNAGIVPVRIDSPVPRLGIFAKRNIISGEEITYDYSGGCQTSQTNNDINHEKKTCHCGASICQGFLPFDISLVE